jgi:hypothetical protein
MLHAVVFLHMNRLIKVNVIAQIIHIHMIINVFNVRFHVVSVILYLIT